MNIIRKNTYYLTKVFLLVSVVLGVFCSHAVSETAGGSGVSETTADSGVSEFAADSSDILTAADFGINCDQVNSNLSMDVGIPVLVAATSDNQLQVYFSDLKGNVQHFYFNLSGMTLEQIKMLVQEDRFISFLEDEGRASSPMEAEVFPELNDAVAKELFVLPKGEVPFLALLDSLDLIEEVVLALPVFSEALNPETPNSEFLGYDAYLNQKNIAEVLVGNAFQQEVKFGGWWQDLKDIVKGAREIGGTVVKGVGKVVGVAFTIGEIPLETICYFEEVEHCVERDGDEDMGAYCHGFINWFFSYLGVEEKFEIDDIHIMTPQQITSDTEKDLNGIEEALGIR